MKKFLKSTTAATVSLAMILPQSVVAQGELSQCRMDGNETLFPCIFNETVIRDRAVLQLIVDGLAQNAEEARNLLEAGTAAAEAEAKAAAEVEAEAARVAAELAAAEARAAKERAAAAAAAAEQEELRAQQEAQKAARKAERQAQREAEKAAR